MGGVNYESTSYKTCYLKVSNSEFFIWFWRLQPTSFFVEVNAFCVSKRGPFFGQNNKALFPAHRVTKNKSDMRAAAKYFFGKCEGGNKVENSLFSFLGSDRDAKLGMIGILASP